MINFIIGFVVVLVIILLVTWGFIMGREDMIDKAIFGDSVSAYGKRWKVTATVIEKRE